MGVPLLATLVLGVAPTAQAAVDPAQFRPRISNPYLSLQTGDRRVYRVTDAEGAKRRQIVRTTARTRVLANGVRARAVYTVVAEHGKRVEDNLAWYAQDHRGTVWYFGERARDFEGGRPIPTPGSWEAGVHGALGGIVMAAHPRRGLRYEEERAPGVAQDRAVVRGQLGPARMPFGNHPRRRLLLIEESSPLDPPGFLDIKLYARGVGLVLGSEVAGGTDREQLVAYERP